MRDGDGDHGVHRARSRAGAAVVSHWFLLSVALQSVRRANQHHHLRTATHTELRKHALRMPAHRVNTDGQTSGNCFRRRAGGYQSSHVSFA